MLATSRTNDQSTLTRKSLLQKIVQVGGSTLLSRVLGVFREQMLTRFLGVSALSDAFLVAYKFPSSLRKIFAEGALSAAFIPAVVQSVRVNGRQSITSLMTLGFLIFESIVIVLCIFAMWKAHWVIGLMAPGFSPEQAANAAVFLNILMPFIFFISTSALLAGPLQAVGHFFVPAFGPVLLNIVYIAALVISFTFKLPITFLCWAITFGGLLMVISHIVTYVWLGFGFGSINYRDLEIFGRILMKFFWCFLSMSVMEVSLIIDSRFGSSLPEGSISLMSYANRFVNIPLGVFATSFSTILLPHFSRITTYAPRRLRFYLLEASKLVWWMILPATLMMMFLSRQCFVTIYMSDKFTLAHVDRAVPILHAFLVGLFFFSIHKILLSVYYSLHNTIIPAIISVVGVLLNIALGWILMARFGAAGLTYATAISFGAQVVLLFALLRIRYNFDLYLKYLALFMARCVFQSVMVGIVFALIYHVIWYQTLTMPHANFFHEQIGFWFWVGPLCALYGIALYYTRSWFNIHLMFLE